MAIMTIIMMLRPPVTSTACPAAAPPAWPSSRRRSSQALVPLHSLGSDRSRSGSSSSSTAELLHDCLAARHAAVRQVGGPTADQGPEVHGHARQHGRQGVDVIEQQRDDAVALGSRDGGKAGPGEGVVKGVGRKAQARPRAHCKLVARRRSPDRRRMRRARASAAALAHAYVASAGDPKSADDEP